MKYYAVFSPKFRRANNQNKILHLKTNIFYNSLKIIMLHVHFISLVWNVLTRITVLVVGRQFN